MTDRADQLLAKAALDKTREGRTPTAREANALKRVQREAEEEARWKHYRSVSPKHYKEMSGRSAGTLIAQQKTWGIPCATKVIDLEKVVRWVHDFIADNAQKLLAGDPQSAGSKALERYRTAMAEEKEMEIAMRKDQTFSEEEVREVSLSFCANALRCLSVMEYSLATEVEVWFGDPQFRAMSVEERRRAVLGWAQNTVRSVRTEAADGFLSLIQRDRRSEREEGGGYRRDPALGAASPASNGTGRGGGPGADRTQDTGPDGPDRLGVDPDPPDLPDPAMPAEDRP